MHLSSTNVVSRLCFWCLDTVAHGDSSSHSAMLVHTTNIESPKQVTPRDTLSVHKRPGLQLLHELRLPLHALAEDQRLTFNVFVHKTGETGTSQPSCALIILWPWLPLVHPGPGCTPCKAKQSLKKGKKGRSNEKQGLNCLNSKARKHKVHLFPTFYNTSTFSLLHTALDQHILRMSGRGQAALLDGLSFFLLGFSSSLVALALILAPHFSLRSTESTDRKFRISHFKIIYICMYVCR